MQTIDISLPDQFREFVDLQDRSGGYSNVSEYVRELIKNNENYETQRRLEASPLEDAQSDDTVVMTRQEWKELREEALRKYEARKAGRAA